ncbi:uncharacterized protein LOC129773427 [Toxorhynchites rutilus septentrionalis]|uniref:uncharacterized protein LOC129773427 n=1 Tax=Toxorhynchites rutilus septentrionalis TaxID=329112 RepID=UPI002478DB7C|nr:uncharacterized protein LOC129773427 [Toxorhynchites rutilus septentrionalis]
MEKEQHRSVIRFLFLEGKSRSEIKERLDAVYGDPSPSMATVKNWFNEFQRGREIAETVCISKARVGHTLHKILGMRKLSARWVPHLLTPDNKRIRETTSEHRLTLFKRNPKEFLRRCVTVDETWIHWYTSETKERLKPWTSPGERAPKKAKNVLSAGKVMATVFWY